MKKNYRNHDKSKGVASHTETVDDVVSNLDNFLFYVPRGKTIDERLTYAKANAQKEKLLEALVIAGLSGMD